ncbi:phage Gp37/Gp68 family protein [Undibacterium sp. TJN19]|uniref:phage Gp37/Gp68 family protein n=1 Tax=Undibacterium sp. TJN19 TaxID=3413055 RepID=UPI003BF4543E
MSENTNIEWCDHTFNGWTGCTAISPGCDNCYAKKFVERFGKDFSERTRTSVTNWKTPLRWNAKHAEFFAVHGRRQRVFCSSLADVFDNAVSDDWRADLFNLIAATPNLDWLLLTKRIGNVTAMVPYDWTCPKRGWPVNVWLGATIVNQVEAERDIPKLLRVPATKRFLSMEPLLGPVDLTRIPISGYGHHEFDPIITANVLKRAEAYTPLPKVDWVIDGGESGPGARPKHPDWSRSLRDQCEAAGIPYFHKQWGEWYPWQEQPLDVPHKREIYVERDGATTTATTRCDAALMLYVGKKAAGRLLDGVEHNGFPEV